MTTDCRKCGHRRVAQDPGPDYACPACGAVYAKVELAWAAGQAAREEEARRVASARRSGDWSAVSPEWIRHEAQRMVLVTLDAVPGRVTQDVLGIISGDHAIAFGALREAVVGLARNIAGTGDSPETVNYLASARTAALQQLRFAAVTVGADAVVGCRVDFEEISGANAHGVLVVSATGTAVRFTSASPT